MKKSFNIAVCRDGTNVNVERFKDARSWRTSGDFFIVDEEIPQEHSKLMPDEFSTIKLYTTIFFRPLKVTVEEL